MTFPLEPEEQVIKEGGASHAKGIETAGGHLWLLAGPDSWTTLLAIPGVGNH